MTPAEITQCASDRFWRAVRRAAFEVGAVTVTFTSLITTPVTAKPAPLPSLPSSAQPRLARDGRRAWDTAATAARHLPAWRRARRSAAAWA
jgi:hypothetical protein